VYCTKQYINPKKVKFTKKKIIISLFKSINNFLSLLSKYININAGIDKIGKDHKSAAAVELTETAKLLIATIIAPPITKYIKFL
tara:strand:- start:229 stop:480 length:252 start_codon:yes stop_codon:yes gene_type:complete